MCVETDFEFRLNEHKLPQKLGNYPWSNISTNTIRSRHAFDLAIIEVREYESPETLNDGRAVRQLSDFEGLPGIGNGDFIFYLGV
jgi:hypothetical protein